MSEELNTPPPAETPVLEAPAPEATAAPTPPASKGSFEALQEKAVELMKNPIVVAGGAVIIGLVVARIAAGSKLRQVAVQALADFIKVKTVSTLMPQPAPVEPPPAAAPVPEPAAPANPLSQLGKQLLDSLGPQLGDLAKKKLAEFFPNKQ